MAELYPDLSIDAPVTLYTTEAACRPLYPPTGPDGQPQLGTPLWLTRVRSAQAARSGATPRGPVLLIHGLSANRHTFLPQHRGVPALAAWLARRGHDVWLEEWRGTGQWSQQQTLYDIRLARARFTLDAVAQHDHPTALRHIEETWRRETGAAPKIAVIAHCVGAATFAMTIARGLAGACDRVVLSALGLFFSVAPHRQLLAHDHILDAVIEPMQSDRCGPHLSGGDWMHPEPSGPAYNSVPYRDYWAEEGALARLYDLWSRFSVDELRLTPRCGVRYCERVSFMYGEPYLHRGGGVIQRHLGAVHHPKRLPIYFGPAQVQLFHHAVHSTRAGKIVPHPAIFPGQPWIAEADTPPWDHLSAESRGHFRALDHLTLLTGHQNHLWARDSVDRMFEWLQRGPGGLDGRFQKKVLASFAHQDLYWGHDTPQDAEAAIYEGILAGALD